METTKNFPENFSRSIGCLHHFRTVKAGRHQVKVCQLCKKVLKIASGLDLDKLDVLIFKRAKQLLIVLCLLLATPAWASPLTFDFTGTMTSGTGLGSFSYDTAALPAAVNTMGGYVYSPTNWSFQLRSTFVGDADFSSALSGHTGSLCVGICTFGSGQQLRLDVTDGGQRLFHFSFGLTEPLTVLPAANQIGGLGSAQYKWSDGNGAFRLSIFQAAGVSPSAVDEPEPWALLACGLAVLVLFRRFWKEVHGL